jgi:DNA-binding PucR family transcriptional regulator
MKTDVITVSSKGSQMEAALSQVDKAAAYKGLRGKNALHLRLLAEEMMGMMRSITGETEGQFWIEDEDNVYQLHLQVTTRMDSGKRGRLLSASSSGKNESARGLMGRLRDFFDRSADEDIASYSNSLMLPGMYDHSSTPALDWEWSMLQYEDALSDRVRRNDAQAKEDWDELEKSVVARVADDVKVAIRGRTVEMTIVKKMA